MASRVRVGTKPRALRQSLLASTVFLVPVLLVLYFETSRTGTWWIVVIGQVVVSGAIIGVGARLRSVEIYVDSQGITERGFLRRRRHLPVGDIGSVVVANTFDTSRTVTRPMLFVRDHEGGQLMRMRGQLWSRESMDAVSSRLDVPIIPVRDPRSLRELSIDYPGLGYWFERHPRRAAALIAALVVAGIIVAISLSSLG